MRLLGAWAVATLVACLVVHRAFVIDADENRPMAVVASVWSGGDVVGRAVVDHPGDHDARLDDALAAHPGATRVDELVVGEGPLLMRPEAAFAANIVSGRDGVRATLGDKTAYVTPDELVARQAYDHGWELPGVSVSIGVNVPLLVSMLAERLGITVPDLYDRATLRRVRTVRRAPASPPAPRVVTPETLTNDDARAFVVAAGAYLARGVDAEGRFRYLVDAPTNRTMPGYDWPRHSGATYFLAQSAAIAHDPELSYAALRAASYLRDHAMPMCGADRCIGDGEQVDLGSAALAVIAFVEVARTKLDEGYALVVPPLASFLRSMQRDDGEFMHLYNRAESRPIDVQLLYYSGEATLALSRAYGLLGDERDLAAARRGLANLVGPAWEFFGSRYYFGEEHWTCQALDDLWDHAPDYDALDFCLRWHAFGRKLQFGPDDTPWDADGAYGFSPFVTPRLTPVGSRSEAGIATLHALRKAGRDDPALDQQMRRSLALLIRHQFSPGPTHLFAYPAAVEGGMPGSAVDWQLRIDYAQHSGSAMVRWLNLNAQR
jgi:hypothetical protein